MVGSIRPLCIATFPSTNDDTYETQIDDINRLKIIHVAGTKGKGSTCAFIESLLRTHGLKTGLYTGPHLIGPEERIRIGFSPLKKDLFTKYVTEIYETLRDEPRTPKYLQLLTLVSFHAFIKAGVDVAIYETHHGGEYDATNFIPEPTVTAITVIDYDHTDSLGGTLERIAWHKAGILKTNAPAFSVSQQPVAASVLRDRATEKGVQLDFIRTLSALPANAPRLQPDVQVQNFSLAHAVCNNFLQQTQGCHLTTEVIERGLRTFEWPGRFQIITDGTVKWFLDGAHNELSLNKCAEWFAQNSRYERVYSVCSGVLTVKACVELLYSVTSLPIGI
jgi:folylpolyglutamate synthase